MILGHFWTKKTIFDPFFSRFQPFCDIFSEPPCTISRGWLSYRDFNIITSFPNHWRLRKSNRWLRNMKKKRCFWTFYQNSTFYTFWAFKSHWRLRKSNGWLRNLRKTLFLTILPKFSFLSFSSIFWVTGGFGNRIGGFAT